MKTHGCLTELNRKCANFFITLPPPKGKRGIIVGANHETRYYNLQRGCLNRAKKFGWFPLKKAWATLGTSERSNRMWFSPDENDTANLVPFLKMSQKYLDHS